MQTCTKLVLREIKKYNFEMKKIKFVFEEIFKNGGSRRHSMTIDISIPENWETVLNYDHNSEIEDDDKIYTDNPEKWLKVIKVIDPAIFESVTGDEPDESYYNNGPEQERYYFEQIK